MRPEAEWLPTARLLPGWLLRWAVEVIEGAAEAWADRCPCGSSWPLDEDEEGVA